MLGVQFGQAHLGGVHHLVGGAVLGPDGQHHRGSEVDRDARIDAQLGGAGDVGVVAADDDDGVALVGHRVIALDNLLDGAVALDVQLLVVDADAALVGQAGGGMGQQQVDDVVAILSKARDRPEHTDFGHRGGQPMQDPQRDRRLAGVPFRRRDINTDRHAVRQPSRRKRGSRSVRNSSRKRRWSWPGAWNTRWLRPQST